MDIWDSAAAAAKWLLLLATAGVLGGFFVLLLARPLGFVMPKSLRRYLVLAPLLGCLAVASYLLLQTGAVNRSGLAGMLDPELAGILLRSTLGQALGLRMFGYLVALAGVAWLATGSGPSGRGQALAGQSCAVLAVVALGLSFALIGHVATLSLPVRVVLVLHVLAALGWLGALYPLLVLGCAADLAHGQQLLRRFGNVAIAIVAVLLLSGSVLVWQLLESPAELLGTDYGKTLLLKLGGVSVLLLFGATNKLLLVPRLQEAGGLRSLRLSIRVELALALAVLAVTAWLTSGLGPGS